MLVLARKAGQRIHVTTAQGDLIVLTVVDISGNMARLGFDAPLTVQVQREEVVKEIAKHGNEPKVARLERKATALAERARKAMEKAAAAKAQAEAEKLKAGAA